jgi:hypothetical protein
MALSHRPSAEYPHLATKVWAPRGLSPIPPLPQVFLSQIHRRARILNDDFQEWVLSVVMGHAATQEVEPIREEADTPPDSGDETDEERTGPPNDAEEEDEFEAGAAWASQARPASATASMVWRTPISWFKRATESPKAPQPAAVLTAELGTVRWGLPAVTFAGEVGDDLAMPHFTRAASSASSTGGSTFGRTASEAHAMSHFTRAASSASSAGGSTFGRTASDTLRWLSSGLAGGLKKRMGFGAAPRPQLADSVRVGAASSVMTPSNWLKSAVAAECVFVGKGQARVDIYPAPVKTVKRMREKVLEYAGAAGEGAKWPLCANILDPVRAAVVCSGPAEILEVLDWFLGRGEKGAAGGEGLRLLPVCRIKNKFAFSKDEIVGG